MREVDFIALMYSRDRWVRGSFVEKDGGCYIEQKDRKGRELIRRNTLSQFSGFVSSDGKRIYENSILKFQNKEISEWVVVVRDGCFMVKSRTTVPEYHTFHSWKETITNDAVVIGTIFDNYEQVHL